MGVHSIVDVARELISWSDPNPGSLLLLACYFDDSGTHAGSPVVVFGGLIGQREHWEDFEPKWKAKLAQPLPGKPPLKRFHMFDCKWGLGEFIGWSEAERNAVTHDFRQIILDCGVTGVSAAIARADYDELVTGEVRTWLGSADEVAFGSVISALDELKHHGLTLIFDDTGDGSTARYAHMYERYQAMFRLRKEPLLSGVSFRSMLTTLPLQGADMIAWETYFLAAERLKNPEAAPRPHLQRYIETERFFAVFLTREHIIENMKGAKERIAASLRGERPPRA